MNFERCNAPSLLAFIIVCWRVYEYTSNLRLVYNYVLTFEFACISWFRLRIAYPIMLFMDHEVAWQFMYNDLNTIWNVEWLALHFDLGFLCRSNYEYMFMCLRGSFMDDCKLINGWLITDVTGSLIVHFELWTGYPDMLISL